MIIPSETLLVKNNPIEFGWELFCWQGYLRFISKRYKKIIIHGKKGHYLLYKDFCHEYIPHELESKNISGHLCFDKKLEIITNFNCEIIEPSSDYIFYSPFSENNLNFNNQKFIKFGKFNNDLRYDILLHSRNLPVKIDGINRNYGNKNNFKTIVSRLKNKKIATIGGKYSDYIEGTDDLRNVPLETLADICASSNVIVGSLSGPIHFASLCGLEQITWSGIKENKKRVEKDWNPFNTKTTFLHCNVFPNEIMDLLKDR